MANSSLLASSWLVLHLTWKAKSWHNWQTIQWLGICAERERKWKNYDSIPFDLWTCDSVHVDEPFQDNGHQQDILRTQAFNLPIVLEFKWMLYFFLFIMRWPNKRTKGSCSLKCSEQEKGNFKQTNLYLYCFSYHKIEMNPFAWINFPSKKKVHNGCYFVVKFRWSN